MWLVIGFPSGHKSNLAIGTLSLLLMLGAEPPFLQWQVGKRRLFDLKNEDMKKATSTKNTNWRDAFKDCHTEAIRVGLRIIPHESDKQFPAAAVLRVETDDEVYQVTDDLDYRFREGDTGLRPFHLILLFSKMADELLRAETIDRLKRGYSRSSDK